MKAALITGVCGGIGQATARHLKEEGWSVYATDIVDPPDSLKLDAFWKGDVASEQFWTDKIAPEVKVRGSLQAIIHNAAIQPCTPLLETSVAEWDEVMAVNLRASFLAVRSLAPLMKGGSASIVNVASVHALATSAGMSVYVTSKGGLVSFTRAAALDLAAMKIRVNAVLPGAIDTPMLEAGLQRNATGQFSLAELKENLASKTPIQRIGAPEEVARAIAFLIDPVASSFITGQALVIDGGATTRLSTE